MIAPWMTLPMIISAFNRAMHAWQSSDRLLGPMAPTRKRPRRVARKIAARGGRLHYLVRFR